MGYAGKNRTGIDDVATKARRDDLDWLRVIAFWLLIYYHAAILFVPGGFPLIQNAELSLVMQVTTAFLHQFRLALLFLISGAGVSFAMRHRNRAQFMRDRAVRLLVPLVFGVLVTVPPMVFLEKKFIGVYSGSIAEFYTALFSEGFYPHGNLSWHHYWFIAYLYVLCLVCWPLLAYGRRPAGQRRLARWSRHLARGGRLYLIIAPLAIAEVHLRARFPGFPNLISDWANISHWLIVFLAGYLLASNRPLLDRTQQLRRPSLALAAITTATLFAQFWTPDSVHFAPSINGRTETGSYVWFCILRVSNTWFWLLACLGFAGRHLQRSSRVLTYLNAAVYPLFCVHLTAIVALAYVIVPLDLSIPVKYLAITTGTIVLSLGSYELIWRRVKWLRPAVGLK